MTRRVRLALLFTGALAIRFAHLAAIRGTPPSELLFIDSKYYDEFARRLATGAGFPEGPFFMNVLYGAALGGVYAMFGDAGKAAALVLQCILGAGACVVLAAIGERVGRRREGFVAGAVLAAYGPAIFYDAALLTPSLILFLTTAATYLAMAGGAGSGQPLALGMACGLLVLGRANHALLALAYAGREVWAGRRRAAAILLGATAFVVLPVTIRNARVSGEFVPVTSNGGMALWAGNHPGATGIYSEPEFLSNPVPEREAEDYRVEAERRAERPMTLAESSAYWTGETGRRWAEAPGAMARLLLRKLRIYVHAVESQTNLSYYFVQDFSPVLRIFRANFGWILPFAVFGLAFEGRRLFVVALPILVSVATCLLFYVSSEYRHPVVPCVLLFAAIGAFDLARRLRQASVPVRTGAAVLLLALIVLANGPDLFLTRLTTRRVDYANFSTLALDAGNAALAERLARRSIEIDPAWPVGRRKLAEALGRLGKGSEAAAEEDAASRLEGTEPIVSIEIQEAAQLFEAGRIDEAYARFVEIAARGGAERAASLNNAALAAKKLGRDDAADSLLIASIAADPHYASPWIHRGRFGLERGDAHFAAECARRALVLAPGDPRAERLARNAAESNARRGATPQTP